jgi:hypothetical protein
MGAVAQRGGGRVFALAPPQRFFLRHTEFYGSQPGPCVRAITKRLGFGAPARTPRILTSLNFERQGLPITYYRFIRHGGTLHPVFYLRESENAKPAG